MTLLQKIEEYQDEARAEGISIGREQGIGIGRMAEKLELARAFLDLADDKTIATKTGLPIETIKQLRKESEI